MIDEHALRRAFAELQARVAYVERATGLFVDEASLDGRNGDPIVHFVPRGWRCANFEKQRYSQCTPEFLEILAETLHHAGTRPREGKEKFAAGNLKDAARARTWARRMRRQSAEPTPPPASSPADDDDFIP